MNIVLTGRKKEIAVCLDCYWAYPESYHHVATQQIRRLDVEWLGEEAEQFDKLAKQAEDNKKSVPDFVKKILKNSLDS